jgi:Protein of unknown function (DUF3574)
MRRFAAIASIALGALASGGCQLELLRDNPLGCRGDEHSMVREMMYFGASIPGGGIVDDAAWQQFESDAITPAFPRGYTVAEANGHWRGNDGRSEAERSRVVTIIHVDSAQDAQALRAIAEGYVTRFHQESVLRARSAVCAQF